jgi:hypothetical protein
MEDVGAETEKFDAAGHWRSNSLTIGKTKIEGFAI